MTRVGIGYKGDGGPGDEMAEGKQQVSLLSADIPAELGFPRANVDRRTQQAARARTRGEG
jgi:hypothetical protein